MRDEGDEMSPEHTEIDPHVLEDPEIAKQAIIQLVQTKADLEDIIDTLEMLSDPKFRRSMDETLAEVEKGETVTFENTEELKRCLDMIWSFRRGWSTAFLYKVTT